LCDESTGTGVLSGDGTLIQNCLLCGKESRNGYAFGKTAFGDAQRVQTLYEGRLVFVDHAEKGKHPLQRRVEEAAGKVTNVRFDAEGRPRGDIETAYAPQGGLLRDLVRGGFENIGLSHTAQYRFGSDKKTVEQVTEVFSVDVVVAPATVKGFREQAERDRPSQEKSKPAKFDVKKALAEWESEKDADTRSKVLTDYLAEQSATVDEIQRMIEEGSLFVDR